MSFKEFFIPTDPELPNWYLWIWNYVYCKTVEEALTTSRWVCLDVVDTDLPNWTTDFLN